MSRFNVMPRAYRRQLQASDEQAVQRAIGESTDTRTYANTPGGDARKLRGIPAIGRNVRGAIPGSVPGEELWR